MGTDDWRSYADFRAGVAWWLGDGQEGAAQARRMFVRALDRDPNNRGAALNLGILESVERNYDHALMWLESAKTAAQTAAGGQWDRLCRDSVWYKATYQLAVNHSYVGAERFRARQQDAAREAYTKAVREIEELVITIVDTLENLPQSPHPVGNGDETVKQYLESIRPRAVLTYAGILVEGMAGAAEAKSFPSVHECLGEEIYGEFYRQYREVAKLIVEDPHSCAKRKAEELKRHVAQCRHKHPNCYKNEGGEDEALPLLLSMHGGHPLRGDPGVVR